jgi:hypothetical protein
LFAWQLISHKLLRYLAFLPLMGLLVCNALVADVHPYYLWLFGLQLAAYALALVGHWLSQSLAQSSRLLVPYYFVILNMACVVAFWKFLNGQKIILWRPRSGP